VEHEKMLKMLVYHIEIASGTEPAAAKALADAILAPPVVKPPSKAEIAAARTQSENDKTRTMSGRNKNRADSTVCCASVLFIISTFVSLFWRARMILTFCSFTFCNFTPKTETGKKRRK
jgi:hypothetical protein